MGMEEENAKLKEKRKEENAEKRELENAEKKELEEDANYNIIKTL